MLEKCISSFIDGRVRLRHPALHDAAVARQVEMLLAQIPGVRAVTVRPRPGSVLLEYDPEQLSKEDLLAMLHQWEGLLGLTAPQKQEPQETTREGSPWLQLPPFSRTPRACALRYVHRGMLATLAASLGFLAAGHMRGHAVASGLFVALSACHLGAYRKSL